MMPLIFLLRLHETPMDAGLITTQEEELGQVKGNEPHFLPCPVYKIHDQAPLHLTFLSY